jgi:hypothetical protein
MAKVKRTVYLITEQQRDALISYLQNRPFREVAAGIQFLTNAPTAVLNVDVPDEEQTNGNGSIAPTESTTEASQPTGELLAV